MMAAIKGLWKKAEEVAGRWSGQESGPWDMKSAEGSTAPSHRGPQARGEPFPCWQQGLSLHVWRGRSGGNKELK